MFIPPRMTRRHLLAVAGPALILTKTAMGQSFPTGGTIRLITPFPPGGATDALSRPLADSLTKTWACDVTVVQMPGNNTMKAAQAAGAAGGDGRTLVLMTQTIVTTPLLVKNLDFDPVKELAPLSLVARAPTLIIVAPDAPYKSVADLIAAAKAKPGALRYASTGIGTSFHLAGEMFKHAAGINLTHLQTGGAGEAIEALLTGKADIVFANSAGGLGPIKSGKVRLLAVATTQRWPQMPEAPTVAQTLPGFEVSAWFGVYAPSNTPSGILEKQSRDIQAAIQSAAVAEEMRKSGADVVGSTAETLRKLTLEDQARWAEIIRVANIEAK